MLYFHSTLKRNIKIIFLSSKQLSASANQELCPSTPLRAQPQTPFPPYSPNACAIHLNLRCIDKTLVQLGHVRRAISWSYSCGKLNDMPTRAVISVWKVLCHFYFLIKSFNVLFHCWMHINSVNVSISVSVSFFTSRSIYACNLFRPETAESWQSVIYMREIGVQRNSHSESAWRRQTGETWPILVIQVVSKPQTYRLQHPPAHLCRCARTDGSRSTKDARSVVQHSSLQTERLHLSTSRAVLATTSTLWSQ